MTVDEALPNVRGRLEEKARVVASLRDELAEVEELQRSGRGGRREDKRATNLRMRIAANKNAAIVGLRRDLSTIGRNDLEEALTRYVRKSLERKDAYRRIQRLFEAERRA